MLRMDEKPKDKADPPGLTHAKLGIVQKESEMNVSEKVPQKNLSL